MSETKEFPTLLVASTATGIGLGTGMSYSDIKECASWLCGHPVWTHEIAHKPTVERYRSEVARQFPDMPTKEEAEADFEAAAAKAINAYGDTVIVHRGKNERLSGPISTLAEMMEPRT